MSNTDEPVLLTAEDLEGFRNHKKNWNTFIVGFMVASCIGLVLAFAWNETETHKLEQAWLDNCLTFTEGQDGGCLDLAVMIDNKNPNFFPENTKISLLIPAYIQQYHSIQE